MPMPTPATPLPDDAEFYRVVVNVPQEWQVIIDGLIAEGTLVNNYADAGIGNYAAANSFQDLAGFFYLSDLCCAIATCFQAIAITPYDDLTDCQKTLLMAMQDYDASYGRSTGNGNSPTNRGDTPTLPAGGCDNDRVFALTTQLTDFIHTTILDLYDLLLEQTNKLEFSAELLDNIPGLGVISFIGEYVTWMFESVVNDYAATYTAAIRDEIRCDLFCIAVNGDCNITINQLCDYFAARCGQVFTPGAILANVLNPLTGIVDDEQAMWASHYTLCVILAAGAQYASIPGPERFIQILQSFTNDTDPDWEILCDPCGASCLGTFDFETGNKGGWEITPTKFGSWEATYWKTAPDGGPNGTQSVWIDKACGDANNVQVIGTNPQSNAGPYAAFTVKTFTGGVTGTQTSTTSKNIVTYGDFDQSVTIPDVEFDTIQLIFGTNQNPVSYATVKKMIIT